MESVPWWVIVGGDNFIVDQCISRNLCKCSTPLQSWCTFSHPFYPTLWQHPLWGSTYMGQKASEYTWPGVLPASELQLYGYNEFQHTMAWMQWHLVCEPSDLFLQLSLQDIGTSGFGDCGRTHWQEVTGSKPYSLFVGQRTVVDPGIQHNPQFVAGYMPLKSMYAGLLWHLSAQV